MDSKEHDELLVVPERKWVGIVANIPERGSSEARGDRPVEEVSFDELGMTWLGCTWVEEAGLLLLDCTQSDRGRCELEGGGSAGSEGLQVAGL